MGRITYEKAKEAVQRYVARKTTRCTVTSKDVCNAEDIEYTEHNRVKVHAALAEELEEDETWSTGRKRFRTEDDD